MSAGRSDEDLHTHPRARFARSNPRCQWTRRESGEARDVDPGAGARVATAPQCSGHQAKTSSDAARLGLIGAVRRVRQADESAVASLERAHLDWSIGDSTEVRLEDDHEGSMLGEICPRPTK